MAKFKTHSADTSNRVIRSQSTSNTTSSNVRNCKQPFYDSIVTKRDSNGRVVDTGITNCFGQTTWNSDLRKKR